jgi:hypothetical protein
MELEVLKNSAQMPRKSRAAFAPRSRFFRAEAAFSPFSTSGNRFPPKDSFDSLD